MTISIKGLDHVVVCVADLDRAIAFYSQVLGCTVERRVDSIKLVQLRAGRSLIDLLQSDPGQPGAARNMDHFAVQIDPFDEADLRRHLEHHGVAVGDVQTRYGAEGSGPSIYIQDPDGNTVELKGPASQPPKS